MGLLTSTGISNQIVLKINAPLVGISYKLLIAAEYSIIKVMAVNKIRTVKKLQKIDGILRGPSNDSHNVDDSEQSRRFMEVLKLADIIKASQSGYVVPVSKKDPDWPVFKNLIKTHTRT